MDYYQDLFSAATKIFTLEDQTMIYRFMFVGYSKDVHSVKITADKRYYVSLSYRECHECNAYKVYMYVESNEENVSPELLADGALMKYPNGTKWERANEIFHYSRPVNKEQWRRKAKQKTPYIMVNRLKPEKVSSYIYYHYQYQEEYPGDGDRYGVIYLHGQQMVFYLEHPTEAETETIEGALHTKHTPIDQWQTLMDEHFADQWRGIENLEFSDYIKF